MSIAETKQPGTYAAGVRLPFAELPDAVKSWVSHQLRGPIEGALDLTGGFSPGVAAIAHSRTATLFIKAVGAQVNPDSLPMYLEERLTASRLPDLPGLQRPSASADLMVDGEPWVVTAFPVLKGSPPQHPWSQRDAVLVLDRLAELGDRLTPSPWLDRPEPIENLGSFGFFTGWRQILSNAADPWREDPWVSEHLAEFALTETELVTRMPGDTLSHFDLRADNILVDGDEVWFVDWAHARHAAPWLDPLILVGDFIGSGADCADGGAVDIPELLRTHRAFDSADEGTRIGLILCLAGALHAQSLRPAPPALPTIRGWQDRAANTMLTFVRRNLSGSGRR